MRVRILPAALDDLIDIDKYVSGNFGRDKADQTYMRLFQMFNQLTEFPGMGRPRPDVTDRAVQFFLLKPYWIIYEPGMPLLILRIYHAARSLKHLDLT